MTNPVVEFREYCKENPDLVGVKSVIWQKLSEDFGNDVTNVRGYGVNNSYKSTSVFFFLRLNSLLLFLLDRASIFGIWTSRAVKLVWSRMLSLLIFRSIYPAKQFSFKDYNISDYHKYEKKTGNLTKFLTRPTKEKYGVEFSHHTFKSFCYLAEFHNECPQFEFTGKNVLEIGGGMLNFSILCNEETDEIFYIVVDLPEVIEAAYLNVNKIVDDVEVFLPHQKNSALSSKGKKKLLFLVPGQLDDLELEFDLFVNHESFAEMDIAVVEGYLNSIRKKMKSLGYIFLVNRFFRVQNTDESALPELKSTEEVTSFDRYKPDWCEEILYKVETFRQHIKTQRDRPNAIYIGRIK